MAIYYVGSMPCSSELYHYGVKGMKWGEHLFGLVENVRKGLTAPRGTIGRAQAWAQAKRNVSSFGQDFRNTAYNARQLITGSEDRKRMKSARTQQQRLIESARAAEKSGNAELARKMRIQAMKYKSEADQAQKEYESMTIPGMAEKTYRNISKTFKQYGVEAEKVYRAAKERVTGAMAKMAKGADNAARWLMSGFAAVLNSKQAKAVNKGAAKLFEKFGVHVDGLYTTIDPDRIYHHPTYSSNYNTSSNVYSNTSLNTAGNAPSEQKRRIKGTKNGRGSGTVRRAQANEK